MSYRYTIDACTQNKCFRLCENGEWRINGINELDIASSDLILTDHNDINKYVHEKEVFFAGRRLVANPKDMQNFSYEKNALILPLVHRTEAPRKFNKKELLSVVTNTDSLSNKSIILDLDGRFSIVSNDTITNYYLIAARDNTVGMRTMGESIKSARDWFFMDWVYMRMLDAWRAHLHTRETDTVVKDVFPEDCECDIWYDIDKLFQGNKVE